jgi:hypothetical protein
MLKIWLIDDLAVRADLEKVFWAVDKDLGDIKGIFLETIPGKKSNLYIITDFEKLKAKYALLKKELDGVMSVFVANKFDQSKVNGSVIPLYLSDLSRLVHEMKGGV